MEGMVRADRGTCSPSPEHRVPGMGLQKDPKKGAEIPAQGLFPQPNISFSLPTEFITTAATPESAAEIKKAKRVRGGRRKATHMGDTTTVLQSFPRELFPLPGALFIPRCSPCTWIWPPAADQPPWGGP